MKTFKDFLRESWAVTGVKLGTVVSIKKGGVFDSRTIYFLAKDNKWVEVSQPYYENGKFQSVIVNDGENMSDEELSKLSPEMFREPSQKIDSIYDLEAMPIGAKISDRAGVTYTKTASGWVKDGAEKAYSVIYMTGVLENGVTHA